jgi:hypothetical protein
MPVNNYRMMEKYVVKQIEEAKEHDEEWLVTLKVFCDANIAKVKSDLEEIRARGRDKNYPYVGTSGSVFAKYEDMLINQLEQLKDMRSSLRRAKLAYEGGEGHNELVEEYDEHIKDQVSGICAQVFLFPETLEEDK